MNIVVRINGKSKMESPMSSDTISKLNLDVTTMMAFVSALTCDSCKWKFTQPILADQAKRESLSSTKTFLDEIFQGKKLNCVQCFVMFTWFSMCTLCYR